MAHDPAGPWPTADITTYGAAQGLDPSEAIIDANPDDGQNIWAASQDYLYVLRPGATVDEAALIAHLAPLLARYKLPKQVVFVDRIERSPSGKADYRWAAETAVAVEEA